MFLVLSVGVITASAFAAESDFRGTPKVVSGDLIELQGRRLRLEGIDAPEPGQRCALDERLYDCGEVARTALLDLTAGTEVRRRLLGPGPAGSPLARCTAAGYDLSEGMVYAGWALAQPAATERYGAAQEQARAAKHGLWRGRFVAPWEWSAGKRLPEEGGD